MNNIAKTRMVVDKARLVREFQLLGKLMTDYRRVLGMLDDSGEWSEEVRSRLHAHQALHYQARFSVGTVNLVIALLKDVVGRLGGDIFTIPASALEHWESGTQPSEDEGPAIPPDQLIAWVGKVLEGAPLDMQDILRRVLVQVLDFIKRLEEQNETALEAAMARVNLATSSPQSQRMLRDIILITRDIFQTLDQVSSELPMDAITETTGSISEQIRRLKNVISRLDESSTENLNLLESLINEGNHTREVFQNVLQGVRDAEYGLSAIKDAHPELSEKLDPLLDQLGDHVGAPAMSMIEFADHSAQAYLDLMSNLTFQEMTGKTLTRIIDFIENLERQLLEILDQYQPGITHSPAREEQEFVQETAVPEGTQSQADVDRLLEELNF